MWDIMRGWQNGLNDSRLRPDDSSAESTNAFTFGHPTATGFKIDGASGAYNQNNGTYIYIAIRRGPMAVPTDATDVFALDGTYSASSPQYYSGWPVDFWMRRYDKTSGTDYVIAMDRLRGNGQQYLNTTSTAAESFFSTIGVGQMDGADLNGTSNSMAWLWRRAPSFFDVVAYTGNGTAGRTVSHNLGVAPEMIWVKQRNAAAVWTVYHSGIGETKHIYLSDASGAVTQTNVWNDTAPTDTAFTTGTYFAVNDNNDTYIAYLFASLDGVSKLGTFTTTSGALDVDCGFSSGARFVLLKKTNAAEDWFLFDSERGIVSGNDPYLYLNDTNAEATSSDPIDPLSSGFTVNGSFWGSGNTYIFYAIA
jgi:hypothetical protein